MSPPIYKHKETLTHYIRNFIATPITTPTKQHTLLLVFYWIILIETFPVQRPVLIIVIEHLT